MAELFQRGEKNGYGLDLTLLNQKQWKNEYLFINAQVVALL